MSGGSETTTAAAANTPTATTPRGGGKTGVGGRLTVGKGVMARVGGAGGSGARGGGRGGGIEELTKEEKEDRINKKMEEIRRKNEAIQKRHQEIEEDKKSAKDKNATLDIKRQSASVAKTEATDLASRLGSGNVAGGQSGNEANGIKSTNLTDKKNKVVQFGPEFDLNVQIDRKKVRPSLYAAGRGKRLAALQGKEVESNPGQQQQHTQQHQHHQSPSFAGNAPSTHPLNPFAESKLEATVGGREGGGGAGGVDPGKTANLKRRKSFGKNSEFFGRKFGENEFPEKDSSSSNWNSANYEGRKGARTPKGGSQQQWRNDKFEDINGNQTRDDIATPMDTDWRRERAAIDSERVKRSKDAAGTWKRAWDSEKVGKADKNDVSAKPTSPREQPQQQQQQHQQPQQQQNRPKKEGFISKESAPVDEFPEGDGAENESGVEQKRTSGPRPSTKSIKAAGNRIGSGRFINTGDSRPGNKATSPSASSAPPTGESTLASAAAAPTAPAATAASAAVFTPQQPASTSASTTFQFKGVDILASKLQPTAIPFIPSQQLTLPQQQPISMQQRRPLPQPQPAFTANFAPASAAATTIAMPRQFQPAQLQQQQQQLQQHLRQQQPLAASLGNNVFNVATPFYRAPLQLNLQAFGVMQQRQKHQQLQRGLPPKVEPSFERPSKRLNKVGGEDADVATERKPNAPFAPKPRRSGGGRPDAPSSASHRRAGSRPRHIQPSPAAKQHPSTMQLVKIEIPDDLHAGWRKPSDDSPSATPNGKNMASSSPTTNTAPTSTSLKTAFTPDKSLSPSSSVSSASAVSPPVSPPSGSTGGRFGSGGSRVGGGAGGANSRRRVEAAGDSLKIQLRLSPAEALRLAAKDLEMSSAKDAAATADDDVVVVGDDSDFIDDDLGKIDEMKRLPKDSDSLLKKASKQKSPIDEKVIDPRTMTAATTTTGKTFASSSSSLSSFSALKETSAIVSTEAKEEAMSRKSPPTARITTPNSLALSSDGFSPEKEIKDGSASASPASTKRLSPAFPPRGFPDSPSSVLSPKSKILADIKKQRENRSREDELELDEYNPEDELDELLLKPEDILGEDFSLTSGIEGLCVDDLDEHDTKMTEESSSDFGQDSSKRRIEDHFLRAGLELDHSIRKNEVEGGDDDDDDEWEDMSHDDSATTDDAADGETKEDGRRQNCADTTKSIKDSTPEKSDKLSFLLHDDCVAIVGDR